MVTLRMIAEKCGVSLTTVSKALNDAQDLNARTKERIRKTAREMGYRPNVAAKALRTNRSYSFGIIYEEAAKYGLTHEFFSSVLNSFMTRSQELGYDVFFLGDQLAGRRISYADHARYRNCDGILVIVGTDSVAGILEDLNGCDCPVVSVDYEGEGVHSIFSDNARGMRELVDYAVAQGHRRIAFLHGEDTPVTRIRLAAFREAISAHGITLPEEYVSEARYHNPGACQRALQFLLSLPEIPTCVLLPDDIAYLGAVNEFAARGMRVPQDISVMGYDGIDMTQYVHPKLTTMRQDAGAMGRAAADILAGQPSEQKKLLIPGILIPGETVRRINP